MQQAVIAPEEFTTLQTASKLLLSVSTGCEEYLHERLSLLEEQFEKISVLASANELPDASISDVGLKNNAT
jgi:hypothetical protein